jgi:hypothetical protein
MPVSLPPKYVTVIDHNYNMTNPWYTYFFDLTTAGGTYQPLDTDLTAISGLTGTGIAVRTGAGTWTTRTLTGTANKIDVTNGDGVSGNPTVTISATYVGQTSITTLGTIGTGTWNGSSISTSFTDAKIKTVTGTANRITIGGTATDPTFDISASYVGQATITTLGTITTGTWNGTTIAVANGGTGQTSYTNGQLLIGNTTGNTLTKATLTAGTGITITNGTGSITIASTATSSIARTFMLMGG